MKDGGASSFTSVPEQKLETQIASAELTESVATILARFSGHRNLASRMRDRFGNEVNRLMTKLESAIHAKNQNELTSALHSIKGLAATLGAIRLANRAAELEVQSREGLDVSGDAISSFRNLADKSVLALEQLDFDAEKVSADIELLPEQLRSLLDEADEYLAEDNMNAMPIAEKLIAAYKSNSDIKIFYAQVESLDFTGAQKTLKTLKKVLLKGHDADKK